MTRNILIRIVAVALATTALAAPTAFARPEVTPAARHADTNAFATRPVIDRNPTPADSLVPDAPADRGIDWTTIAVGIAGGLLAVGAIAGIAVHARQAGTPTSGRSPRPVGVSASPADTPRGGVASATARAFATSSTSG